MSRKKNKFLTATDAINHVQLLLDASESMDDFRGNGLEPSEETEAYKKCLTVLRLLEHNQNKAQRKTKAI